VPDERGAATPIMHPGVDVRVLAQPQIPIRHGSLPEADREPTDGGLPSGAK